MTILDVINPGGILILGGALLIGALVGVAVLIAVIFLIIRMTRKNKAKVKRENNQE